MTMAGRLIIFLPLLFLVPGITAQNESSFDLTATKDNFGLYYPTYLANGFFTTSTSPRGTDATLSFMVGVMDYTVSDVPRLAALPSWAEMDYFDGTAWLNATAVTDANFQNYRQTLQMFDGVLSTQYVFANSGHATRVAVTTFVSEDSTHVGITSLSLTPEFTGDVRLRFTLRPHPAPAHRFPLATVPAAQLRQAEAASEAEIRASDLTAPERGAEWYPGYVDIQSFGAREAERVLWMSGRAVGGLQIAEAAAIELPAGVKVTESRLQKSRQLVSIEVALRVERGRTYTFTKYVAATQEKWGDQASSAGDLEKPVINWAKEARGVGFDSLIAKHRSAWHELWKSDIVVDADPEIQRVIHSDLFYLYENSTVNTSWAMGGCGLSPNYWGHYFWDSDSWDMPALLLLHPERAKPLVMFRYRTLPAAEDRAKAYGYRGAMYPWESDPQKGIESTDHDFVPIGAREIHLDGDIIISQWQYYLASGDTAWLRDYGYKVIHETAEFLTSRVTYNREQSRYEVLHVCSGDEIYNDVSNDSFTNAVIQKALRAAVMAARVVGESPDPQWSEIAQKMYIPFSEKEQRHLDFDEVALHVQKSWMGSSLSWLSYPPLDLAMSNDVRQNDYNFATKSILDLTPNIASINDMVPVIISIDAATVGDAEESYKRLKFSNGPFLKPPFNVRSETPGNNHLYILCVSAGFIENFLYGYTGLRLTGQGLTEVYPPILPSGWKSVIIRGVKLHDQSYDYVISRGEDGKVRLERHPEALQQPGDLTALRGVR
jgi:protein-glucosylgalactosylhydroxylysine glucosidase